MRSLLRRVAACLMVFYITPLVVAGELNEWQNIHPTGVENGVGGYVTSGMLLASGRAFAYTTFSRMYDRSTPQEPWTSYVPMVDGVPFANVFGFFVLPSAPNQIFARTSTGSNSLLVRSDNGGDTWTSVLSVSDGLDATAVAPSNSDIIYANTVVNGFLKSVDGGSSWTTVGPYRGFLCYMQVDAGNPDVLYALESSRIIKSEDGGLNWAQSDNGVHPVFDYMDVLTVDLSNPGTLYAGSGGTGLIFKTTDGAENWTQVGLPSSLIRSPIDSVAVDPSNPNIVYALSGGSGDPLFYRSVDAGTTWAAMEDLDEMVDFGRIVISTNGDFMYFGATGAGILDNSGRIRSSNQGLSDFPVNSLSVSPDNSDRIFGLAAFGGLIATNPAVPLWENRRNGMLSDARDLHIDPLNTDHLLISASRALFESHDEGRNWTEIDVPGLIQQFEVASADADIIHLLTTDGLVTSIDGGNNLQIGLAAEDFPPGGIFGTLVMATADGVRAYVGTGQGGLFGTEDRGQSWGPVTTPFGAVRITDIAADPHVQGPVYVSTDSAVWYSGPSANNWVNVSEGHNFLRPIYAIAADAVVPGRIFVETNSRDVWALNPRTLQWSHILDRPASTVGGSIEPRNVLTADPSRSGRLLHSFLEINEVQLDSDLDGTGDDTDNCILTANTTQLDTDGDGLGNACDQDIAPATNDCRINFLDLTAFKNAFFTVSGDGNWNPDADFDGDGDIDFVDLDSMQENFFLTPGYAAGSACR